MAADPQTRPGIAEEIIQEVDRIVRQSTPDHRPVLEEFQKEFAAYTGARHAVAVNSGTAALHLALLAHGIGTGDRVITSPLCRPAVASAILATGASPLFVDINPYTYTISPGEAERAARMLRGGTADSWVHGGRDIPRRSKPARRVALLATHLFGQPCEMDAMADIAQRHSMALIEVAWDALGACYDGRGVGSNATACYSFQQGMAICTGEGGMLTTNNDGVAVAARRMANYGCDCCGLMEGIGFNYRMTELSAALGRAQLPEVDGEADLRRHWAQELSHELLNLPGVIPPSVMPGAQHAYQRFALRLTTEFPVGAAELCLRLREMGVKAIPRPLLPLHLHPFSRANGGAMATLCNAERVARELVVLPLHQFLDGRGTDRLVAAIRGAAASAT